MCHPFPARRPPAGPPAGAKICQPKVTGHLRRRERPKGEGPKARRVLMPMGSNKAGLGVDHLRTSVLDLLLRGEPLSPYGSAKLPKASEVTPSKNRQETGAAFTAMET